MKNTQNIKETKKPVLSLFLGILGFISLFVAESLSEKILFLIIFSISSIIMGVFALKEIKLQKLSGKTKAIIGICLGSLGLLLAIFAILFFGVFSTSNILSDKNYNINNLQIGEYSDGLFAFKKPTGYNLTNETSCTQSSCSLVFSLSSEDQLYYNSIYTDIIIAADINKQNYAKQELFNLNYNSFYNGLKMDRSLIKNSENSNSVTQNGFNYIQRKDTIYDETSKIKKIIVTTLILDNKSQKYVFSEYLITNSELFDKTYKDLVYVIDSVRFD